MVKTLSFSIVTVGLDRGQSFACSFFFISFFLNELEDHLLADQVNGIPVEYKTGDFVHFIKIFILLYADDTIILSDSAVNLQKVLIHSSSIAQTGNSK